MTSRAAVPWTVTVPRDSVAVGPVAASAGEAAPKPTAAVAITATIPASRRRCELVCMVLLLCECWCCVYATADRPVRAARNPSITGDRVRAGQLVPWPAGPTRGLEGAKRSGLAVQTLDVPVLSPASEHAEPSTRPRGSCCQDDPGEQCS